MVNYKAEKHFQGSWPWWRCILTGLNIVALFISLILSWHYLERGSLVGCSGGSPCEQVLNSRWSTIAGILPVSGLATGVYLAILVAGFFIGPATESPIRHLAWSAMLILVGSVAGSAIWFSFIQEQIIGNFCLYCMTMHIAGLLLSALVIWRAIKEFENHSDDLSHAYPEIDQDDSSFTPSRKNRILPIVSRSFIGLILAGILAGFQIGFTPPAVYNDGEFQENLPAVDYRNVPMVGSPDAPYIVALLFDYKCPHCQQLHLMLNEAIRRFKGKLAFALYPTPLNTRCNPYISRDVDEFKNSCELAKIALAVWLARREVFSAFDNWMFTYESGDRWHPRSLEAAKAKAVELVGKAKFDSVWNNPWIGHYMQICIRTYGQTMQGGKGGVPKLVFGAHWVIPDPNSIEDLIMILQKTLAVPQP